jgi:hypothetical protein
MGFNPPVSTSRRSREQTGAATAGGSEPAHRLTAYRIGSYGLGLVPAPAAREWMSRTDELTAYRCLPMLIANQSGWLVLNNATFTAIWNGGDGVDAVSLSYPAGQGPLAGSYFGYGIITWSIPYLFRTPPGFNLLVRGPANSPKDAVSPLEGVVEADWASSTFTMNWKLTRPFTPVEFEAGEPICMIVPQRRGELERFAPEIRPIEASPEVDAQHQAWWTAREEFIRGLGAGDGGERPARWQRDYFKGRRVGDGEQAPDHQTRLHLRPFSDAT